MPRHSKKQRTLTWKHVVLIIAGMWCFMGLVNLLVLIKIW